MKKKSLLIGTIIIIFAGVLLYGAKGQRVPKEEETSPKAVSEMEYSVENVRNRGEEVGKLYKKYREDCKKEDGKIYAKGKTVTILQRDYEHLVACIRVQGKLEAEARLEADKRIKETETLYAEAIRLGYEAGPEEIEEKIEEIRNMFQKDTSDELSNALLEGMYKGYGSEEGYWEYEKEMYQKLLPIEKMFTELEAEQKEKGNSIEIWREEFKEKLVEAQSFS